MLKRLWLTILLVLTIFCVLIALAYLLGLLSYTFGAARARPAHEEPNRGVSNWRPNPRGCTGYGG